MTDEELLIRLREPWLATAVGDEASARLSALVTENARLKADLEIRTATLAAVVRADALSLEIEKEAHAETKRELATNENTRHTIAREQYEKWSESGIKTIEELHCQLALCHEASASALDLREKALDVARRTSQQLVKERFVLDQRKKAHAAEVERLKGELKAAQAETTHMETINGTTHALNLAEKLRKTERDLSTVCQAAGDALGAESGDRGMAVVLALVAQHRKTRADLEMERLAHAETKRAIDTAKRRFDGGWMCLVCLKVADGHLGERCNYVCDACVHKMAQHTAALVTAEEKVFRAGMLAGYDWCEREEGYESGQSFWEITHNAIAEALARYRQQRQTPAPDVTGGNGYRDDTWMDV